MNLFVECRGSVLKKNIAMLTLLSLLIETNTILMSL